LESNNWRAVLLLFGTHICSIDLGSAAVDTLGQLFTLHLYNALRKRGLIQNVSFLRDIDKVYDETKAVWVEGLPEIGSFAKQFSMAWGMSIAEASRLAATRSRGNVLAESIKLKPVNDTWVSAILLIIIIIIIYSNQ
jgi:hypothetical protein